MRRPAWSCSPALSSCSSCGAARQRERVEAAIAAALTALRAALAAALLAGPARLALSTLPAPRQDWLSWAAIALCAVAALAAPTASMAGVAPLAVAAVIASGDRMQLARAHRAVGLVGVSVLLAGVGMTWTLAGPPPGSGAWLGPALAVVAFAVLQGLWPFAVPLTGWLEAAEPAAAALWGVAMAVVALASLRLWSSIPGGPGDAGAGLLHSVLASLGLLTVLRGGLLSWSSPNRERASAISLAAGWGAFGLGLGGGAGQAAALLAALDLAAAQAPAVLVGGPAMLRRAAQHGWPPWPGFWSRLLALWAAYQVHPIWLLLGMAALLLATAGSFTSAAEIQTAGRRPAGRSPSEGPPSLRERAACWVGLAAGLSAGLWLALAGPLTSS